MTPERHRRVKEIFLGAIDLASDERDRFLSDACSDDPTLRDDVERMLRLDDATAARALEDGVVDVAPHRDDLPESIGPYRVESVLGEGGMGIVYRARQSDPDRTVAVKVLRRRFADPTSLRRFHLEAQLLGDLRHPGITHVYESGRATTSDGALEYIAMELVDGESISTWVERERPGTAVLLELVARVCDAVGHAHLHGVIHRDLKPSNILVTSSDDGVGQPRILDFGVALATTLDTRVTQVSDGGTSIIGTVAYMSPEQVSGGEIDLRTDVYALGVMLYELLAGRAPLDFGTGTLAEAARIIRDEEPQRLASLDREWKGDIDTIVARAMEKDPSRRYQSALALGADLRRHLRHEPIEARPASLAYQTSRFARRHKAVVAGVAVAFLGMASGTAVSVWKAIEATRQRDLAILANGRVERVRNFMAEDILNAAAPDRLGPEARIIDAVRQASTNLDERFGDDDLLRAQVEFILGGTFYELQQIPVAIERLEEALAIFQRTSLDRDRIRTMAALAKCYSVAGRRDEAIAMANEAVAEARATFGDVSEPTANALTDAAFAMGDLQFFDDALPLIREAYEIRVAVHGAQDDLTLKTHGAVTNVMLHATPQDPTLEDRFRERIDRLTERRGATHSDTLVTRSNFASFLIRSGRFEEAAVELEAILPDLDEVLGSTHAYTTVGVGALGMVYSRLQRYEQAMPLLERSLQMQIDAGEERSPNTIIGMINLTLLHYRMESWQASLDLAERSIVLCDEVFGHEHQITLEALYNRARPLARLDRLEEAIEAYDDVVVVTDAVHGPESSRAVLMLLERADLLIRVGRHVDSEADLRAATGRLAMIEEPPSSLVERLDATGDRLYEAWGVSDPRPYED